MNEKLSYLKECFEYCRKLYTKNETVMRCVEEIFDKNFDCISTLGIDDFISLIKHYSILIFGDSVTELVVWYMSELQCGLNIKDEEMCKMSFTHSKNKMEYLIKDDDSFIKMLCDEYDISDNKEDDLK